jgi:hypothetical protein
VRNYRSSINMGDEPAILVAGGKHTLTLQQSVALALTGKPNPGGNECAGASGAAPML